jgi:hypothetical protein
MVRAWPSNTRRIVETVAAQGSARSVARLMAGASPAPPAGNCTSAIVNAVSASVPHAVTLTLTLPMPASS